LTITDEASALEYADFPVQVVQGRSDNIKITYPDDLELAQLILAITNHKLIFYKNSLSKIDFNDCNININDNYFTI
jgi:hypothetical protein